MKSKKWRLGGVLLAAVILAGSLTGMAFANTDQTGKPDFTAMYQSFISKFAANLGVSEDQVTAAMDATQKQMVDEAVQQGKLTQEQADKIQSTNFCFPGFGFGRGGDDSFKGPGRKLDSMATALGITTDQLNTELEAGKKIEDIAADQSMTMDQFNQKMLELKNAEISKAVSEGKLTQDQADNMLQKMGQHHLYKDKQDADANN
ncbi:MAG: YckD family protein [Actinobacteria bacterium]|nr:YckD family protein [Actinomycetota bacterium]